MSPKMSCFSLGKKVTYQVSLRQKERKKERRKEVKFGLSCRSASLTFLLLSFLSANLPKNPEVVLFQQKLSPSSRSCPLSPLKLSPIICRKNLSHEVFFKQDLQQFAKRLNSQPTSSPDSLISQSLCEPLYKNLTFYDQDERCKLVSYRDLQKD